MKIKADTIARTAVLVIALLNQILAMTGKTPLDISNDTVYQLCTLVATVGASLWAWWKNNSFTRTARTADMMKENIQAKNKAKKAAK